MMATIQVELGDRTYPIYINAGCLDEPELLIKHIVSTQVLVVTNETVAPLYLQQVLTALEGFTAESVILPDGEQYKTLASLEAIFEVLLTKNFSRNATIIALGGGVIGDMSGFTASCYQRGIAFIQIPTTLLAQVDSSVGGKTGVNHRLGKNMIGAFHQPQAVLIDIKVLNTLDNRQLSAGIAEVIKYGLIYDAAFFTWIELNLGKILAREQAALTYIIERSCAIKAEVVAKDERESGIRAILNLGHTFGHAIETGVGYGEYLHGEAIAIGMCQAADLSRSLGWLTDKDVLRIEKLFKKAMLPIKPPVHFLADEFIAGMSVDKKNIEGDIRVILLKSIGEASLPMSVDKTLLLNTLSYYGRE